MEIVRPSAFALVTAAEAREFLNKKTTADQDTVQRAINRASEMFEMWTGRLLKVREMSIRTKPPRGEWYRLKCFPVDVATAVTCSLNGQTLTVWRKDTDGTPEDFDVQLASKDAEDPRSGQLNAFWRDGGWRRGSDVNPRRFSSSSSDGPNALKLTWKGGFGTAAHPIPEDLKAAVLYVVHKLVRDAEKQTPGLQSISAPNGGVIAFFEGAVPKEVLMAIAQYAVLEVGSA